MAMIPHMFAHASRWAVAALVLALAGCKGGADAGTTEPPPPAAAGPRILINDAATLARYRNLLAQQAAPAVRFKAMVDAEVGGAQAYAFMPWYAALMARLSSDEAYCRFAVLRTDTFVAEEETLIRAGNRPAVAGDSYLEIGQMVGNVALVYDWCRSTMTDSQRTRWTAYANQAVWNVWNHERAQWGGTLHAWSGWSVDNPVNNYYYSFLEATMLLALATQGENDQAQLWRDTFRQAKLEAQLFPVFNRDLQGGGSREGTGYGTAMKNLFRLFDWWERSTGERLATRSPHTLASMAHLVHAVVPTLDRLTPTGDHARDSTAALFDYHRDYLLVLMRLFPAERLTGVAASLLAASSVPRMANGFMAYSDFLYDPSDISPVPLAALATTYWGAGTGQLAMRSSWARDAAYANFICGPYTESHAHRDQGSFTLFKGNWLAYDANVESASGIEQAEELHNLVRVEQGGSVVPQREGAPPCEMLALADNAHYTYGVARITPVYNGHAAVAKVEREFLFIKPATFVVFDRVQTSGGARRVWTLNLPAQPTVQGDTLSLVQGSNRLDVVRLAPTGLSTQMHAWAASGLGMQGGVRVDVADDIGDSTLFLHVLGTDGAVARAERADAPGSLGAQITLADGGVATVRFATGSAGATLELRNAGGAVISSGALPTTVQVPALFASP
jgi:hypothetical protein